jgi:hypothetical protein
MVIKNIHEKFTNGMSSEFAGEKITDFFRINKYFPSAC